MNELEGKSLAQALGQRFEREEQLEDIRLQRAVLSSQVTQVIIDKLLSGTLIPGQRLVEKDLSDALGVSRSPIREALTELARSGVVIRTPGKGARVKEWTEEDLDELFVLRSLLEGHAASQAAKHFSRRDEAEFRKILDDMKKAGGVGDYSGMIELDLTFHRRIWDLSGNRLLTFVLEGLTLQFKLFLAMIWKFHGGLPSVAENHMPLFEALRDRDDVAAAAAMREHVTIERARPSRVSAS